jgi:hypothetical protein
MIWWMGAWVDESTDRVDGGDGQGDLAGAKGHDAGEHRRELGSEGGPRLVVKCRQTVINLSHRRSRTSGIGLQSGRWPRNVLARPHHRLKHVHNEVPLGGSDGHLVLARPQGHLLLARPQGLLAIPQQTLGRFWNTQTFSCQRTVTRTCMTSFPAGAFTCCGAWPSWQSGQPASEFHPAAG